KSGAGPQQLASRQPSQRCDGRSPDLPEPHGEQAYGACMNGGYQDTVVVVRRPPYWEVMGGVI
ncbi:hypothetical protein PP592_14810, partial [Mycobacteroides abscessus]|nr:hypothetical protein [Mycobacteroides abscessus]